MDRPTLIGPDALHRPAAETPGVDRREAFVDDHVWAGRSRTEGGAWSGWHVHPGHDTYVFQTQGRLRLEFGPGEAERRMAAEPGWSRTASHSGPDRRSSSAVRVKNPRRREIRASSSTPRTRSRSGRHRRTPLPLSRARHLP